MKPMYTDVTFTIENGEIIVKADFNGKNTIVFESTLTNDFINFMVNNDVKVISRDKGIKEMHDETNVAWRILRDNKVRRYCDGKMKYYTDLNKVPAHTNNFLNSCSYIYIYKNAVIFAFDGYKKELSSEIPDIMREFTTETSETEKCYVDTDNVSNENADTKEMINKIHGYFDEITRLSCHEQNVVKTTIDYATSTFKIKIISKIKQECNND